MACASWGSRRDRLLFRFVRAGLVVCILVLGTFGPAQAQPPPSRESAPAPRRAVSVGIIGASGDDAHVLEDTIRELLARLQLTMVPKGTPSSTLLASVEVDLSGSVGARVI